MPKHLPKHKNRRLKLSPSHLLVDLTLVVLSFYIALWLRLGAEDLKFHLATLNRFLPIFVTVRLFALYGFDVYASIWRYISPHDIFKILKAAGLSSLAFIALAYFLPNFGTLPRSFFFIDALLCVCFLSFARIFRKEIYIWKNSTISKRSEKVLIYGAGQSGRLLARQLTVSSQMEVCGFIDDDPLKQGRAIYGVPVLGTRADLEKVCEKFDCHRVILTIQSPAPELMRSLVSQAHQLNFQLQVFSGIESSSSSVNKSICRNVELKDLLNRPSTSIDFQMVGKMIQGKVVLVTGAGGSIGAELSRQICKFSPKKLILIDHSEFNLYEIDRELRVPSSHVQVSSLLTDVKDKAALSHVFSREGVEVVFHAAAYKHVHLVEANPSSAVLNNVLGTQNLLELSQTYEIERFLLISTDKAVNPGGVMGATKRICEVMVSQFGEHLKKPYSSVRFGNVLGSSGSLIPLLKKQIEGGGPVTITHPDMTRYFMLIPEAVSLVLMSSFLAKPGDISVLKMGEPVKILDLAKSLIALMGRSEEDIPIVYTGIRPGEKMFEELYLIGNEIQTHHPDIMTLPQGDSRNALQGAVNLKPAIDKMISLAANNDPILTDFLKTLVEDCKGKPAETPPSHTSLN